MSASFEELAAPVRAELEGRHSAREEVLRQSRLLIQTCSRCIKQIHRRQDADAAELLEQARGLSASMRQAASAHPEVLFAGHIQDAEKEMVEAAGLLALARNEPLPSMESLGVSATSYLNGMGEAASEARRFLLDDLRHGRTKEAEAMLGAMEAIYDELTTFDFPDAVTGGLRRTCDALRAVIERTRSDLTMTMVQRQLMERLEREAE